MYENGPVNGQVDARTINGGYAVTDSFHISEGPLIITGIEFWVWLYPGDQISSVEVSIGSTPYGTDVYDAYVEPSHDSCFVNRYGYSVCRESVSVYLYFSGNTWLTVQNANDRLGAPVYWDQNSGVGCMSKGCPSKALQQAVGVVLPTASVPSETFTIYGYMYADGASTTGATH